MGENLKWIWLAFGVGWALHILYVYTLAARQRSLRDEVKQLRAQMEEREPGEGAPLVG